MREKSLSVAILYAVFCITNIQSVSFINKCKSNDSKCAKESAQVAIPIIVVGLPEYNVETMDPLTLKRIDASSPNLQFILNDVAITGFKNCVAKKIKRDKPKSKLFLKFLCTADLDGLYEMKGNLLFLSIEGKGPIHVKLRKAEFSIETDLDEKNDKWTMKNWNHTFELKDRSEIVFENLFNGNEVLGNAARDVIANSGNDIFYELGPKVFPVIIDVAFKEINKFFSEVSAKELSID